MTENCIYSKNKSNLENCMKNCTDELCNYACKINLKNQLENRIWYTRKYRIYAADRIKSTYNRIQLFSLIFSLYVVALSIINLSPNGIYETNKNEVVSILLLIASITITMFSIYTSTQNYQERYICLKNNYIKLGELIDNLKSIPVKSLTLETLQNTLQLYTYELSSVENHLDLDVALAKLFNLKKDKLQKGEPDKTQKTEPFKTIELSVKSSWYAFGDKTITLSMLEIFLLLKYYAIIVAEWFITIIIGYLLVNIMLRGFLS